MKRGYTTLLLCLVAVVTSLAQGAQQESVSKQQSAKAPQATPTVDQIIDMYVQVIGGASAIRKLTSRVVKMTLVIEDSDVIGSFESYRQVLNKGLKSARLNWVMAQYNNIMYIAAGEAITKAQNSTWEEVVASRIFKPLGMKPAISPAVRCDRPQIFPGATMIRVRSG